MRRAKLLVAIGAASVLLLTASAGAASANSPRIVVQVVQMSGDQEVTGTPPTCAPPAVCGDPDASGRAFILIVPRFDLVCWHLSWRNIDGDVVAAHVHGPATPAQAAGILVPLTVAPAHGCVRDTDADAIAANPSQYYVNVHTTVYPAGAIRGQLH